MPKINKTKLFEEISSLNKAKAKNEKEIAFLYLKIEMKLENIYLAQKMSPRNLESMMC